MENSKYLQKKLESKILSEDEWKVLNAKLNKPIETFVFLDQGKIAMEKGDLKFDLSYSSVPADLHFEKREEVWEFPKEKQYAIENMDLSPKEYRKLDNLVLKNKESTLDVVNLLPKEAHIFFRSLPYEPKYIGESPGSFDPRINLIILKNNLSTPGGILTLLHEIGHANDKLSAIRNKFPKKEGPHDKVFLTPEQIEIFLKTERNAWTFVIKNLKPFISDLGLTLEEFNAFVHDYALSTYSEKIKKMQSGQPYIE